jgi:tellurite resistance protein TerC
LNHIIIHTVKQAKRLTITVIGFTILAIGIAMVVLAGPAVVVIPIGLALLATDSSGRKCV